MKKRNVKLIVVDSIIAHFRSEYVGREMLAERQQKLEKHLHRLIGLARAFNAVAVVTNQVQAKPETFTSETTIPTGGNILGHISHTRVMLRKTPTPKLRIARLVVSPNQPEGKETPFKITEKGIEPPEEKRKTAKNMLGLRRFGKD